MYQCRRYLNASFVYFIYRGINASPQFLALKSKDQKQVFICKKHENFSCQQFIKFPSESNCASLKLAHALEDAA